MKKYYHTRLYQVSSHKGYLQSGKFQQLTVFKSPDNDYKLCAANTIHDEQIIIIEKIFPYLAREIKTGIIFPIVDFTKKFTFENEEQYYMFYPFGLIHTFIASEEGNIVANEIKSTKYLEEYDKLHPNVEEFKKELLDIITKGKTNMDIKLRPEQFKKNEKETLKDQKTKIL